MDSLPDHLIIEILSRLNDSTQLARCKCLSKTLNTLARQVRSIHLHCSLYRYTRMRSPPETGSKVTPFKTIFYKLISDAKAPIESASLGVDNSVRRSSHYDYEFEENCDDLFLTAGPFSGDWMAKIGHGLKSISIKDFSSQSSNKETNILQVLSYNCHCLVELTLKNASLYVDDMHLMPLLTRLKLKHVSISDESLDKLMQCVPHLQVLNLIKNSGVLIDNPKIHHLNLKELNWILYESPDHLSSLSIFAPNLTNLEFECDYQIRLSIHAPLLSYCNLDIWRVDLLFHVEKFKTLKTLGLVSWDLHYILSTFPSCTTVQDLTFNTPESEYDPQPQLEKIEFSNVSTNFPNVASLTLGSNVWSQLMLYPLLDFVAKGLKDLKQITLYLVQDNIDKTLSFILYIVGICSKLTDIVLFIHCDVDLGVGIGFVLSCMSQCPKVRFRWGTWREGTKDRLISNSIAANTVQVAKYIGF